MLVARLIAEVTKLAEDGPELRAIRLRLIINDLAELGERLVAANRRLDALERRFERRPDTA
jgi:hypothetical protein